MKKGLGIFLLLLATQLTVSAQFGITGRYFGTNLDQHLINETDQGFVIGQLEYPGNSWEVGIDYWLRLKNTRIEFLPTLSYGQQVLDPQISSDGLASEELEGFQIQHQYASFFVHTNIYLFDLSGDCDCPTFSKSDPIFRKGFFLQIAPGVSWFQTDVQLGEQGTEEREELLFGIGAGIGLDLGISDLITISPMVGGRYYPNAAVQSYNPQTTLSETSEEGLFQYHAAIRLGIRLDP